MIESKTGFEGDSNEIRLMEFIVAGQHFGINVAKVREIIRYKEYPITPMPNANPFVEGVFKPRDKVMTVINLAAYMGLPPSDDEEHDILIVTTINKVNSAFHVHKVQAIQGVPLSAVEKPDATIYGGEEGLATGIANHDGRLITIVDFEKIIIDISPTAGFQVGDLSRLGQRKKSTKPIMIVEDSPILERLLMESLDVAGYENISCFQNGREAWEALQKIKESGKSVEEQVCCVISDIEMPQMDGHRLLQNIREDAALRKLPVIFFSSLITEEMRQKGAQIGATAQLEKPEIMDLVHIIDANVLS